MHIKSNVETIPDFSNKSDHKIVKLADLTRNITILTILQKVI